MLPKPIRDLTGDEAARFKEIDRRSITDAEREGMKRSKSVYHAIKPRRKNIYRASKKLKKYLATFIELK